MTNSPALRKAAILISEVDTRTADALLDSMDPAQALRVREAVMGLHDVSIREREQVLEEFLANRRSNQESSDSGIEIDDSLARQFAPHPQPLSVPPVQVVAEEKTTPFRFLQEADTAGLAQHLQWEQPQTLAVVLSHLPADQAAEVLSRWPVSLQTAVVRRIATLTQTNPEIIEDIEKGLEPLFRKSLAAKTNRSDGTKALRAILLAMDAQYRNPLLEDMASADRRLAVELALESPGADGPLAASAAPLERPRTENARNGTSAERLAVPLAPHTNRSPNRLQPPRDVPRIVFTIDEVACLDSRSLALLFHHANPEVALLAMAGSDRCLFEGMSKGLPASEVRRFEYRLHHLGPVRLRDIDTAQRSLTEMAGQLAERGLIPLPASRLVATGV